MSRSPSLVACCALCALVSLLPAARAEDPPPPAPSLAIVGARLLGGAEGPLASATVLIGGGKILAVGADVTVPEGLPTIDGTGCTVIPGLVDAASSLYVRPEDRDASGGGLRMADGLDSYMDHADQVLAEGVTAVHVLPGSASVLGGLSTVARVSSAEGTLELLAPEAALRCQIGVPTGGSTSSLTRLNDYASLREALFGAREYVYAQQRWERATAAWKRKIEPEGEGGNGRGGGPPAPRPERPAKPEADPTNASLARVLAGELPLLVEAYRVVDIRNALSLVDEFHVRLVLLGCSEGGKLAEEIARRQVAVIIAPVSADFVEPSRVRYGELSLTNAGALERAGVTVALAVGGAQPLSTKLLRASAALAVQGGMSPSGALAAVTSVPARLLGLEGRLGAVAVGCDADLVLVRGEPLDPRAPVELTLAGGAIAYRREGAP